MATINKHAAALVARQILIHLNKRILDSSPATLPGWCISAKPYLRAIAANNYGMEDPHMCVLYALNNLHQWRGAEARELKLALQKTIE